MTFCTSSRSFVLVEGNSLPVAYAMTRRDALTLPRMTATGLTGVMFYVSADPGVDAPALDATLSAPGVESTTEPGTYEALFDGGALRQFTKPGDKIFINVVYQDALYAAIPGAVRAR